MPKTHRGCAATVDLTQYGLLDGGNNVPQHWRDVLDRLNIQANDVERIAQSMAA